MYIYIYYRYSYMYTYMSTYIYIFTTPVYHCAACLSPIFSIYPHCKSPSCITRISSLYLHYISPVYSLISPHYIPGVSWLDPHYVPIIYPHYVFAISPYYISTMHADVSKMPEYMPELCMKLLNDRFLQSILQVMKVIADLLTGMTHQ